MGKRVGSRNKRMSDEEKAVGCWAGAGLQPPCTPPHSLALRVSHCLPPQRVFSAPRTDKEVDLVTRFDPTDDRYRHLAAKRSLAD